jgi:hypothetical protein
MTSSFLLNIRRDDSGFIAQVNELIAIHYSATLLTLCCDKARDAISPDTNMVLPNAFEPAILMMGEQIPLPQFVISYETVIKF